MPHYEPPTQQYCLPTTELLAPVTPHMLSQENVEKQSKALMDCLQRLHIQAKLEQAIPGPVVTTYKLRPARSVSIRVFSRHSEDIARSLMTISVFIQPPVPGMDTVGVVVPNTDREIISFREIAESDSFRQAKELMELPLIIGKNTTGWPYLSDLAKMPNLLIAGEASLGKSACRDTLLTSLLLCKQPDELKILLVDSNRVEMTLYEDEPHLIHPVVKEVADAQAALQWAVHEMNERYNQMSRLGTNNIIDYNEKLARLGNVLSSSRCKRLKSMPYIVLVIEELADLMLQTRKAVEPCIIRLAQLGRACGIHMIIATQTPTVDVVTGLIKANFPCRVSFRVSSQQASLTTLSASGAEKLLGYGDMFFVPRGGQMMRLHGPLLKEDEVQAVVEHWKAQAKPKYHIDFSAWNPDKNNSGTCRESFDDTDPLYKEVLDFITKQGNISTSALQHRFQINSTKAAKYVERLKQEGRFTLSSAAGAAQRHHNVSMVDKAIGCLMGQVIGDSLGSGVEFMSSQQIHSILPQGIMDMGDSAGKGGRWNLAAGQPTDDSEMALALARSIVENGGIYDATKAHDAYVDWMRSPGAFGIGSTIGPALIYGCFNKRSQGNGALMRVSPLGIWGASRTRSLLHQCAIQDARLTHTNPYVAQVNEIFASLIAEAITRQINGCDLYESLLISPKKYTSQGNYLPEVEQWIRAAENEHFTLDEKHTGWVALAFWNALYRMLHTDNFTDAVLDTVNAGGDTDTNAAICGALMGAIHGIDNIPNHWRKTVLLCRPEPGKTSFPRPQQFWPINLLELAIPLLYA